MALDRLWQQPVFARRYLFKSQDEGNVHGKSKQDLLLH